MYYVPKGAEAPEAGGELEKVLLPSPLRFPLVPSLVWAKGPEGGVRGEFRVISLEKTAERLRPPRSVSGALDSARHGS